MNAYRPRTRTVWYQYRTVRAVLEMVPQTGTALQHARTLDGKLPDELKYYEKHAAGSKVYYRCW